MEIAGNFIRLTKSLEQSIDILDRIAASSLPERYYFRNKDGSLELAGLGEGYLIQGDDPQQVSDDLKAIWNVDEKIRVFGGMGFEPAADAAIEWSGFGAYRFVIPFIEFFRNGDETQVTLTWSLEENSSADAVAAGIDQRLKELDTSHRPAFTPDMTDRQSVTWLPEKSQWSEIVHQALSKIQSGEIGKIVLARKKVISAPKPFSADWIIRRLSEIEEKAFLFLYQPENGSTFLGRTPERLFQLTEKSLTVDAIAGTEPRGGSAEEDQQYEQALTYSPKEREEQQIVARYVNDKMTHLCDKTQITSESSVLKLDKVQHLVTRFSGTPREGLTAFETLRSLHPTPAVGVHPPVATSLIGELEPFARGWYAGPIGWMSRETAEFAVAIRSALIRNSELHIFAGAGIVAQSDTDREWREIDDKMANFSFITGTRR